MTIKTAEKQNGTVTAQQAREALLAEKQQREVRALGKVNVALQEENCHLEFVEVRRNGQVVIAKHEVVANDQ